jgi:hypothetical protein
MTLPRHMLTIELEEHFQIRTPGRRVPDRHWDKFPSRIGRNVDTALRLLDDHGAKATFFTNAWITSRHPALLRRIAEAGHEIACRIDAPAKGRDDLAVLAAVEKARAEAATGRVVTGCRIAPAGDVTGCRPALRDAGFLYECSLTARGAAGTSASVPGGLMRIAVPAWRRAGLVWAAGGGASLRLLAEGAASRMVAEWGANGPARVFDFHIWEVDPETPRLSILTWAQAQTCYRGLDRFADRLARVLQPARFGTLRDHFGLADELATIVAAPAALAPLADPLPPTARSRPATGLSIVIPCFDEEPGLAYLANALSGLDQGLGQSHRLSFVLVDDGSRDGTYPEMQRLFGADPRFHLVRHDRNRGIGAAVLTGIAAAPDDIVAVMDSDCSYDPARIADMLPLLAPDVALVTASPYHRDGGVEGVPEWRLALSRGASRMYRMVLRNKLATYTSCFRVCRKAALSGLTLRHEGYIGVVEMLARLDLAGWRIVEYPVLLETRFFGRSKLKVLRAVAGHLRFMGEILLAQLPWRQSFERFRGVGSK